MLLHTWVCSPMELSLVCVSDPSFSLWTGPEAEYLGSVLFPALFWTSTGLSCSLELAGDLSPYLPFICPPPRLQHTSGTFCFSLKQQRWLSGKLRFHHTKGWVCRQPAHAHFFFPVSGQVEIRMFPVGGDCNSARSHWDFERE